MDWTAHWESIYASRDADEVSWFEASPEVSLRRVRDAIIAGGRSVIDVGGGASRLVDGLLELGLERIGVLDVSAGALSIAKLRLGTKADSVEWIVADVTHAREVGTFDVWHDRAVFHFLLEQPERRNYVELCERTVAPGGTAIVATFAPDGPERCSGLPVHRYDAEALANECGAGFDVIDSERYDHVTPAGDVQRFMYASFRRLLRELEPVGA
jgi:SAM-dependent methyltransferase